MCWGGHDEASPSLELNSFVWIFIVEVLDCVNFENTSEDLCLLFSLEIYPHILLIFLVANLSFTKVALKYSKS